MNADLSFTEDLINCAGTILSGPSKDETFTITTIFLQGQISRKRDILIYSDTNDNVETITITTLGTFDRICGRSGTGVKLK